MKDWITKRLAFLDQMWPYDFTGNENQLASQSSTIFPNPFMDKLTVQLDRTLSGKAYAEILSAGGSLLRTSNVDIKNGQIQLEFAGTNALGIGLYMLRISMNGHIVATEKIMKGL